MPSIQEKRNRPQRGHDLSSITWGQRRAGRHCLHHAAGPARPRCRCCAFPLFSPCNLSTSTVDGAPIMLQAQFLAWRRQHWASWVRWMRFLLWGPYIPLTTPHPDWPHTAHIFPFSPFYRWKKRGFRKFPNMQLLLQEFLFMLKKQKTIRLKISLYGNGISPLYVCWKLYLQDKVARLIKSRKPFTFEF